MADEVIDEGQSEGAEAAVQETESGAPAEVEQLVADKMASIFKDNDDRNQADEDEQTGRVTPENPDGLAIDEEVPTAEAAQADDGMTENPTVEELEAAKEAAVAAGDYEKAIELRDRIKEVESAQDQPAEKGKGEEKTGTGVLTADQRAILKATENWTDADLDILEQNPAFAKMTYRRVESQYNQLSLRYAQEAARSNSANGLPQPGSANAATAGQTATLEALFKDLDKFSEVAGSEMVERFIKPLKSEVLEPLKDVVQFVNESRQRAVADEVNTTMAKIAVGDFADTYGQPDKLTPTQENNRRLLYDAADRIVAGAKAHRVPMSTSEALNRAHLMLTANIQIAKSGEKARKELLGKVRTRSTQITSRPSQRVQRLTPKSNQAATATVEKFWEDHGEE